MYPHLQYRGFICLSLPQYCVIPIVDIRTSADAAALLDECVMHSFPICRYIQGAFEVYLIYLQSGIRVFRSVCVRLVAFSFFLLNTGR